MLKLEDIPFDDQKTWDLISSGLTAAMFQVDTPLGVRLCKRIRPQNIDQLAAVVSLMRPAAMESLDERGVSTTENYARRKNGEEPTPEVHPVLDKCLEKTYGLMFYQENLLAVAKDIAGFSLTEADMLRRGIAKKKTEIIAQCKKVFIDGAEKVGYLKTETIEHLWEMIEKSQRYAFPAAHGYKYAHLAYQTAWLKTNCTLPMIASCLLNAKQKGSPYELVEKFVRDAQRNFNVEIRTPSIKLSSEEFEIEDKAIRFGLSNIKGVGEKQSVKLMKLQNKLDCPWTEFLFRHSSQLNSTCVVNLIKSGGFCHLGIPRAKLIYEYENFKELFKNKTSKDEDDSHQEIKYPIQNKMLSGELSLADILGKLAEAKISGDLGRKDKRRAEKLISFAQLLNSPPYSLDDSPISIADGEQEVLGVSITCGRLDGKNIITNADVRMVNEMMASKRYIPKDNLYSIGLELERVSTCMTKNGKSKGMEMAFVSGYDSTGLLSMVVFAEDWAIYKDALTERATVLVTGMVNTKTESFIVKAVESI